MANPEVKAKSVPAYKQRTSCRVCGGHQLDRILSLGDQYLVNFVREKDTNLPHAPLDLMQCHCGLLQLHHTVNPDTVFREYWYRSAVNQTMRDALADLVRDGLKHHSEGTWVDIGANDGYLLSLVPSAFKKIAFEPAGNFAADIEEHADIAVSDYFGAHDSLYVKGKGICSVISSAAMFYDLDEPNSFVADIAKALAPDGIWINQLNDAPTMIRMNAFDSVCHEHLCYYDVPTLSKLYLKHGLKILNVTFNDVNGGSIRVVASKRGDPSELLGLGSVSPESAHDFAERARKWKQLMGWVMDSIQISGQSVWGYGASTKGAALLQYLGRSQLIKAIADRNPLKHGTVMTGTWIPVTDEATMRRERPDIALVLPWAFQKEFVEREHLMRKVGTTMLFPLPNPTFVL